MGSRILRIYILLLFIFLQGFVAFSKSFQSRWEISMRGGYTFNSHPVLLELLNQQGTSGHTALSTHLSYSFMSPDSGRTSSVYQGIGLSINSFFQPKYVGTPIGIYLFQGAPVVSLSNRLSLDYEWNFGATFGWKKTSDLENINSNIVVGSSVNAYLNIGFKLNYFVTSGICLNGGLEMTHYSNGNTSWPNPGVNTIGGSLGVVFIPGNKLTKPISPFTSEEDFHRGISYDIAAYGAWRKSYFPAENGAFTPEGEKCLLPGHYGVAGISFSPMWDLHPTFRTGISTDIQWSGNTGLTDYHVQGTFGENIKFYPTPFFRQVSVGLSARAELVMPLFSLNVGLGYGVAGPYETRKFYQMLTLKTYLAGPFFLNVGYRMYQFRSPSNLMLGIGVTIGRRNKAAILRIK